MQKFKDTLVEELNKVTEDDQRFKLLNMLNVVMHIMQVEESIRVSKRNNAK